jgi:AAA15 family ATPase/GTPase
VIKIRKLKLVNFCGFREFEIDLLDWAVLYGPNGSFKSSLLHAASLLSSPWNLESRKDDTLFFRRLTYHPDYNPNYEGFDKRRTNLYMEAIFDDANEQKKVIIENNWDAHSSGVVLNELQSEGASSICFYVDADNQVNTQKFQILADAKEEFIDFAEAVYGFKCELPEDKRVEEYDSGTDSYVVFYTDFIMTKYNGTRVHYKRMSAGEKKIATMLTELFNNIYKRDNGIGIILIDNIALHIYYKRHMKLIQKLRQYFPDRQFITTTHSPIIIGEMEKKYLIDMEKNIEGEM